MFTSSITSDDTGRLQQSEQGQATPIDEWYRQITTVNLVLDNEDYSPSSSATEAIRQAVNATDRVDPEMVHTL